MWSTNRQRAGGFTLVEILVVVTISVGLVVLMAALYRSAGKTLHSLRGINKEWNLQHQLRQQLDRLLVQPELGLVGLQGRQDTLFLTTWYSRSAAMAGKPVLAVYRYNPIKRSIDYDEWPLPPWWDGQALRGTLVPDLSQLASRLAPVNTEQESVVLASGISAFRFRYYSPELSNPDVRTWPENWQPTQATLPSLVAIEIERTDTSFNLIAETHVLAGG